MAEINTVLERKIAMLERRVAALEKIQRDKEEEEARIQQADEEAYEAAMVDQLGY